MQLVQLQRAQEKFKDQNIGIAAISYDSPAILGEFARRHQITFPLLADPASEIIRKFHVLNKDAAGMTAGMAHPGFIFVDATGRIREKFFETDYANRFTANNIIGKLFPELTEEAGKSVEAPHISLQLKQSDELGIPGSRVSLIAEIQLAANLHVYAPGVKGYKAVDLRLDPTSEVNAEAAVYPEPKILFLPVINERVPVFQGRFRIVEDVTISTDEPFMKSARQGKAISIRGQLKYQACDDKVCYPPTSVPVAWEVQIAPLDVARSPESMQHR